MTAPSPRSRVITAEKLAAGYEGDIVWKDASFTIDKGEFAAVIGPNGAGKTTLFRLLLGLQKPASGSVRVLGSIPSRGNPKVGYVPQRHTVDSDTNVEALEIVRLCLTANRWGIGLSSREDRLAAMMAMTSVGSESLSRRSLGALSGGELQRVFLAEALVSRPEILLLDEPLSNMDMRREKELLQLIYGIVRSQNVAALLIAHNINPLLPFLDKVIYIANGKVATGPPEDVLTSKSLSELYGVEIEVLRDSRGNLAIIGVEDHHPDQ